MLRMSRAAALLLCALPALYAQESERTLGAGRNYGRSMVINHGGIVATSQVLASQAGAQILAAGGTAVDAAIAANLVLCVTEPLMTSIGGDLFVMYWDAKSGKLTGLNASGPAPKALTPEFLAENKITSMPADRHSKRHGSGRRRGLVSNTKALRKTSVERSVPARHRIRRARLPRAEGIAEILGTPGVGRQLKTNPTNPPAFICRAESRRKPDRFRNPDLGHALD
jgi:hypothetical protein